MKSFIPWIGGKGVLSQQIISLFPPHRTYVEVFGGAGSVLFRKDPSRVEVFNDINSDLINLFRTVRTRMDAFRKKQYLLLASREEYRTFQDAIERNILRNKIDRAVAYYYCLKNSYGGGITTGWSFSPHARAKYCAGLDVLDVARERLKRVYIDNLPFDRLIRNWDREGTFFYCDPPYAMLLDKKGRKYYEHSFKRAEHIRLRDMLKRLRGKFLLSYDDSPFIRELYNRFNIRRVPNVRYTLNNRRASRERRVTELLISNF